MSYKGKGKFRSKFDKGQNFNKGSYDSKECTWLSPCLNEFNKIDEKSILAEDGESSGVAKKIEERAEVVELVYGWYTELLGSIDIDSINRLYTDAQRIRCIPKDISAALGELRNKYDEIRNRKVPELIRLNDYYINLLTKLQAPVNKSLFTNERNEPLSADGGMSFETNMLTELLMANRLKYRGMQLQVTLNSANGILLQFINKVNRESSTGQCLNTTPSFDTILYSTPDDRFYALYPCQDQSGTMIIGFKLIGGSPSNITIEPYFEVSDGGGTIVLVSNLTSTYGGDGKAKSVPTRSRAPVRNRKPDTKKSDKMAPKGDSGERKMVPKGGRKIASETCAKVQKG